MRFPGASVGAIVFDMRRNLLGFWAVVGLCLAVSCGGSTTNGETGGGAAGAGGAGAAAGSSSAGGGGGGSAGSGGSGGVGGVGGVAGSGGGGGGAAGAGGCATNTCGPDGTACCDEGVGCASSGPSGISCSCYGGLWHCSSGAGGAAGAGGAPGCGACAGGTTCCADACTNLDNDPFNCGGCGKVCPGPHPFCNYGNCDVPPCSMPPQPPPPDGFCCGASLCQSGQLCCEVNMGPSMLQCFTPTLQQPTCPIGCPLCN